MAQAKTTNSEKATGAATYKKEQLVASKRYANRDRKSTRLNSSHIQKSRMPSSA